MNLFYKSLIRPLAFRLDPELAHDYACRILGVAERSSVIKSLARFLFRTDSTPIDLMGLRFPNHIGQAAGLDKNGRFPGISSALGFGHIEVGTVTPGGQPGNERPRLFRYPKINALVNRMGFNNKGSKALADYVSSVYPKPERMSPLGINIGKSKGTPLHEAIDDYLSAFTDVVDQADYVALNISSPNTPDLRKLHRREYLEPLLSEIKSHNAAWAKKKGCKPVPCLLKISPDEGYRSIGNIVDLAVEHSFDGIIATNTSARITQGGYGRLEKGGLSGMPIEKSSNRIIRFISRVTDNRLPIIGVGGVFDNDSATRKLDAGASLLQLYTSFVYNGPSFPSQLANSLAYRKMRWS